MTSKSQQKRLVAQRHPQAVAIDAWLTSPEGITCQVGSTGGQYLMNRLSRAFQAGWDAALAQPSREGS